ncbi:MAG: phosphotransferase family protein, partial [Acidimicrobiales bacterium]
GDLARLYIDYTDPAIATAPSTVIVKLPTEEPGGRQVGSMLRAWAREVAFYQQVAPASPGARVPACYHVAADPGADRWVVVLEDRPMLAVDPAAGATPEQAAAAVDALAVFHRTWWQRDQAFDWMPGFDTMGVGGLQPAWLDALPVFRERYAHVVPGPTGAWVERFADQLPNWSDRAATEPLTVVHADYRLDNLIFAPPTPGATTDADDGLDVTIIDWQTALRGPGAMDLTSFCATSLTIADRRDCEADLIARYLDGLSAGGLEVDTDWFERSYDENLLWWMGQFANNLARLEPDDPATQRSLDTMIERTYTAALDRDVVRLLT